MTLKKIIEKQVGEAKREHQRAFGKSFKLWSQYGWWLKFLSQAIAQAVKESLRVGKEKGFIEGIELCEAILKSAWGDREMAKDPDDPEIRIRWLLTELDTYKSTRLHQAHKKLMSAYGRSPAGREEKDEKED